MTAEIAITPGKREKLEKLFRAYDFGDFKWIDPRKIVVSRWVRMKCMFGCHKYGRHNCCPPQVPPVSECEKFFREYETAVVFHFKKKVDDRRERRRWAGEVNLKLSGLERAVFLAGYERVFLLFMDNCKLCTPCVEERGKCQKPKVARPVPEALGVDVFSTVRRYGFPIEVCTDHSREMNRYAFLMIE